MTSRNKTTSRIQDFLSQKEADQLRVMLNELQNRSLGNCPVCGSGVNKWGHTLDCPIMVLIDAIFDGEQPS